ncbi:MAG: hypothetical protein RIE87_02280 [Rhodospirillales bacterium]
MADYRILLAVEGLFEDDGNVRLPAFIAEINTLARVVTKIDRRVSGGASANHFRIVGLSHSSPAAVELEVCQNQGAPDTRAALVHRFSDAIAAISEGDVPEDLDRALLQDLRNLAAPVGEKLGAARLRVNGTAIELNDVFAKKIELSLAGEEFSFGSIDGRLEQINIHEGANRFSIYPEFGPNKVQCHFGSDLLDKATAAVNRTVSVEGRLKYKPNDPFPYAVEVEDIDIFPPDDEMPTFEDLRGIAPNATGDELSEVFIARMRDGWS